MEHFLDETLPSHQSLLCSAEVFCSDAGKHSKQLELGGTIAGISSREFTETRGARSQWCKKGKDRDPTQDKQSLTRPNEEESVNHKCE